MVAPRLNQRSDETKFDSIGNRRQVSQTKSAEITVSGPERACKSRPRSMAHFRPSGRFYPRHRFHSVGNILWNAPGKYPARGRSPSAAVALPRQLS
jgi:hypothetical protein